MSGIDTSATDVGPPGSPASGSLTSDGQPSAPDPNSTKYFRLSARVASHLAVWFAVLAPAIVLLRSGWSEMGDDASIASRAAHSLSLHPALVGMASTASAFNSRSLFGPGPLQFWLLAIPVHLAPHAGLMIGAAVLAGLVLSLTVEAALSSGVTIAGLLVGFTVVDLLWVWPGIFENLPWNAYFPIPFLIASVVLAWRVADGALAWWPVLVLAASVAAQCHLLFVMPSFLLVIVSPIVGIALAGRPQRWRFLVVGLVVGLVSWLGPLLQNFGRHGNLSSLLQGGGQSSEGLAYGIRLIGRAASPNPIWLTHVPAALGARAPFAQSAPIWWGVIVLALLVVATVVSHRSGQRRLATGAAVVLVLSVGFTASYSLVSQSEVPAVMWYLAAALWIVGISIWAVAVATFWTVLSHTSLVAVRRALAPRPIAAGLGIATLTVAVLATSQLVDFRPSNEQQWTKADLRLVNHLAKSIERDAPRKSVRYWIVGLPHGSLTAIVHSIWISEGVAWKLHQDGWAPSSCNGLVLRYTGLPKNGATDVAVHAPDGSLVRTWHPQPKIGCAEAGRELHSDFA